MNVRFFTFFLATNYIKLIVLLSLLVFFLVISGVLYLFDRIGAKRTSESMKKKLNISKSYTVNLNKQTVLITPLRNIKNKKTITLVEFLNKFRPDEQNEIKNWFFLLVNKRTNLIEDEDYAKIVDIIFKGEEHAEVIKAIILVKFVDKEKQVIYIHSQLLLNSPRDAYTKNSNIITHQNLFTEIGEIKKKYEKSSYSKGFLVEFRLFKKENAAFDSNLFYVKSLITDTFYKSVSKADCDFYLTSNNMEICLLSSKNFTSYQLTKFINQLKTNFDRLSEIYGLFNCFDYYFVGSLISDLSGNFDNDHQALEKYFNLDLDKKRKYTIYKSNNDEKLNIEENYLAEIKRIIRNQLLEVKFRSIVHIAQKRVVTMGYISYVKPNSVVFEDMKELKKICKTYNFQKDLFGLTIRKIIPTFINEKENANQKIAINISIDEISNALRSIPHFAGINDTYLILVLDGNELIDMENDKKVIDDIKRIKERGYEIGLQVDVDDYVLKSSTYEMFDYFFFDAKLPQNVKVNSSEFLKAHQALEKIIKFDKVIIGNNEKNLAAIELLFKSGLEYFSSDYISPTNPMLLPVDKKVAKRLLNLRK